MREDMLKFIGSLKEEEIPLWMKENVLTSSVKDLGINTSIDDLAKFIGAFSDRFENLFLSATERSERSVKTGCASGYAALWTAFPMICPTQLVLPAFNESLKGESKRLNSEIFLMETNGKYQDIQDRIIKDRTPFLICNHSAYRMEIYTIAGGGK